jgi:hypothetical protein
MFRSFPMSTNTGVAPKSVLALAVAIHDIAVVITSSPGPIPSPRSVMTSVGHIYKTIGFIAGSYNVSLHDLSDLIVVFHRVDEKYDLFVAQVSVNED